MNYLRGMLECFKDIRLRLFKYLSVPNDLNGYEKCISFVLGLK